MCAEADNAGSLTRRLAMAACTLVSAGSLDAQERDWLVDTSYLSYVEADDRVAVSKAMANLTRTLDDGSLGVSLVHDTMSGASPTGAVKSDDAAVTFSGASGGGSFAAGGASDGSLAWFDDTRVQAGVERVQERKRGVMLSYGGVVSQESDYDSLGANVGLEKTRADKLVTYDAGLAFTRDAISRSDTSDTPEPLGDIRDSQRFDAGTRQTMESSLGVARVLNRRTLAQIGVTLGLSSGYHSDPYKVVSVVDDENRVRANVHESRPGSRLRTSLQTRLVHQLRDSTHALHLGYRHYRDDWGVVSNTVDARLRYSLTPTRYLEPHVRLYRQSAADFHVRQLDADERGEPVRPDSGFASADTRLDGMHTVTIGLKFGQRFGRATEFRVRGELIDQSFDDSTIGSNQAVVFQTSLSHRF